MLYMFGVLIGASLLGHISNNSKALDDDKAPKKDIFFFAAAILLICFIGLRTSMNDTASYLRAYKKLVPFDDIDWSIGSNPLFKVYQSILKKYITKSSNGFIFLTTAFTVGISVNFLKKHSEDFGYSIFIYIALGVYGFVAGAMKQTMATAVALIAVDLYVEKNKKIAPLVLMVMAVLIHPYVIVYIATPFLIDGVWNKKTLLILLGTFAIGVGFSAFLNAFISITDSIGEDYDIDALTEGTGTNILRVLVYLAIPLLSYFYREEINNSGDKFVFLAVNMSLLTFCFSILSLNGAAYAMGRMSRYMDIFQCLVLPYVVKKCVKDKQLQSLICVVSLLCFAAFYYFNYEKYIIWGFTSDWYSRISIFELIKGWNG